MQLSVDHSPARGRLAWLVALFAFGHCMAYIDRNLPAVVAPLLKSDLGLSDAQFGLLDGPAFVLLYVVGVLMSWPLAHSPHRLRLLAACVATWMSGMVVFAISHSFVLLMAGRALVGLGQAVFVPLALGLVVECSAPQWRARSMAVLTASSVVGRSFSLLLGGAALALFARWAPASAPAHWRLLFLAMAMPNLLLIVLLWRDAEPLPASPRQSGQVFRRLFAALRERPWMIGAYLFGAGASVLVVRTVGAWAPSVLHREHGLTPATAALAFGAATLVAQPLGHFIAGALVDRRSERCWPMLIVAAALVLAIPALGALPWAASPVTACLLLALASLAGGTAVVAALSGWPALMDPCLRDAGLRVFLVFIAVAGDALGPWMAGVVSDGLGMGGRGLSTALARVCAMAAVLGIAAAVLSRSKRRRPATGMAA